jgi:hypothetical protein
MSAWTDLDDFLPPMFVGPVAELRESRGDIGTIPHELPQSYERRIENDANRANPPVVSCPPANDERPRDLSAIDRHLDNSERSSVLVRCSRARSVGMTRRNNP